MAEQLTPQERLQPALLDRLTDDEPDKKQELRERRVLSKAQLRQAVLRDLVWLFNATKLERGSELAKMPDGAAHAWSASHSAAGIVPIASAEQRTSS